MVHLKDTVIYGQVEFQIDSSKIMLYNIPNVNNLPILFEEDLANNLFAPISNFYADTQTNLTALKQKSTIAGASSK